MKTLNIETVKMERVDASVPKLWHESAGKQSNPQKWVHTPRKYIYTLNCITLLKKKHLNKCKTIIWQNNFRGKKT